MLVRCSAVTVLHGERRGCMREVGHPGEHHFVGGLFGLRCDACGLPVAEPNRWRHRDCAPPERVRSMIAEIRARVHEMAERSA